MKLSNKIAHKVLKLFLKIIYRIYFKDVLIHKESTENIVKNFNLNHNDVKIILTPNHTSWWDGFDAYILNEKILKKTFNILMLQSELKKFSFFKLVGAIGIKLTSRVNIAKTLKGITELIKNNNNQVLVYFPQGEIMPDNSSFIKVKPGIKYLEKKLNSQTIILPCTFTREYRSSHKPTLYIKLGEPIQCKPMNEYNKNLELKLKNRMVSSYTETKKLIYKFQNNAWISLI